MTSASLNFWDIPNHRRRTILTRSALLACLVGLAKIFVHYIAIEPIKPNTLFTSLIASTVFLLGFLLSGVLSDYKESERIPGELSTSLETLALDINAIPTLNPNAEINPCLNSITILSKLLIDWLLERVPTSQLICGFHKCHQEVAKASIYLNGCGTLQARPQAEMAALLKSINRIETIRETCFIPLVYWLAYASAIVLTTGLLFVGGTNLIESIFSSAAVTFLIFFLLFLISDLDNPFGLSNPKSAENISLDVLQAACDRVAKIEVLASNNSSH
jgi:hypothetical protein